jgi:hypothetical protein
VSEHPKSLSVQSLEYQNIATISMKRCNTTTLSKMMDVHGDYHDNENLDGKMDDDDNDIDDEANDEDIISIRSATTSTLHSTITTRRLTNTKVREIFEYLYYYPSGNQTPPKIPIPFTIVPVNSNGKALSPPSYEFECKPTTVFFVIVGIRVNSKFLMYI